METKNHITFAHVALFDQIGPENLF